MKNNKNNCIICNSELEYFDHPRKMICMICHREFNSTVCCKNGHYICDNCHSADAIEAITSFCSTTKIKNPIEIMNILMRMPAIHIHGPEHHILVGAALLTAYYNCGGEIGLMPALSEMSRRGKQVPGGVCGFWGCCGAGVSTGIFLSIITHTTPLSTKTWGQSNLITARSLTAIGKLEGPRCCKRNSFIAGIEAAEYVKQNFNITIEMPQTIKCEFSSFNEQCKGTNCPFF